VRTPTTKDIFDSGHLQHKHWPDMERKYVNRDKGPMERARVTMVNERSGWWHEYTKQRSSRYTMYIETRAKP